MKSFYKILGSGLLFLFFLNQSNAQSSGNDAKIECTTAEIQIDTLVISYDLLANGTVDSVWLEILVNKSPIVAQALQGDVGKFISPGLQRSIRWYYKNDGVDITDKELSITVKANITNKQNETVVDSPTIVKKRLPTLRPGIYLGWHSSSSTEVGLSLEFMIKKWFSLHSGLGWLAIRNDDNYDDPSYRSIIIPLTADIKLNAGRAFRLFVNGGLADRILMSEDDYLFDINNGLRKNMIGARVGIGFEFYNIRYGLFHYSDLTAFSDINEKLSATHFLLGIRFGGSKAYRRTSK